MVLFLNVRFLDEVERSSNEELEKTKWTQKNVPGSVLLGLLRSFSTKERQNLTAVIFELTYQLL